MVLAPFVMVLLHPLWQALHRDKGNHRRRGAACVRVRDADDLVAETAHQVRRGGWQRSSIFIFILTLSTRRSTL